MKNMNFQHWAMIIGAIASAVSIEAATWVQTGKIDPMPFVTAFIAISAVFTKAPKENAS